MTRRELCSWVLVLAFCATPAAGEEVQVPVNKKDPPFRYQGIGLGSTLAEVRKTLGKPLKEEPGPYEDSLGMGKILDLTYPGLKLELCQPDGHADYYVWSFEVSGADWVVVPGIRPGMTREEVLKLFGEPQWERDDPGGETTVIYPFLERDGWYSVTVREGKVVAFGAAEDWS